MTLPQAKQTFASLMQTSRTRQLTAKELIKLSEARQTMRQFAKPAMNKPTRPIGKGKKTRSKYAEEDYQTGFNDVIESHGYRSKFRDNQDYNAGWNDALKSSSKAKSNPAKPVLIYGNVQRIEAVKTQDHICDAECKRCGHRYFHEFTAKPKMYGLPDGSLLIKV